MSADNEVLIQRKTNGLYKILHMDCSSGEPHSVIADDVDGLETAVDKANKFLEECEAEGYPVEYGLRIDK